MNKTLLSLLFIIFFCQLQAQPESSRFEALPTHPRILFLSAEEQIVRNSVVDNPLISIVHKAIVTACDSFLLQAPVEHVKIGRRMLDKSRECLRRVFYLSYAYRMTHDERYFKRAEQELLAVSSFPDWNPSHFLDVAEMTMAVSIGYDWLYDKLSEESRKTIRTSIIENGINQSLKTQYNGWLNLSNNWNQVCNASMAYGAIATYEDNPELSEKIIQRSIQSIKIPMTAYAPDGGYAEGPMYWSYGTTFNVLLISALEKIAKQDSELANMPGFLKTADYLLHVTGPGGKYFNYSDAREQAEVNPALFWFAEKLQSNNYLLWYQKKYISETPQFLSNERLLPALIIWTMHQPIDKIKTPTSKMWVSNGETPVITMRSSWENPNAIYVGFKGGSPSTSHAHMDIGSFILEADGVRWAIDPGFQEYESLESKGIKIWNNNQNGQRWQVMRYNNRMHNTLMINDSLQRVKGKAVIINTKNSTNYKSAVIDLSSIYSGELLSAKRGVALANNSYVVVRDEIKTGKKEARVQWKILTRASVEINDSHTVTLSQDGKKMTLKITGIDDTRFQTWATTPSTSYDASNKGTTLVGFEVIVPPLTQKEITVLCIPHGTKKKITSKVLPLDNW